MLLAGCLAGCFRPKQYVLNPGQKWLIAHPTEIPVWFKDPETGRGVIYYYTFPAFSLVEFPRPTD